MHFVVKSNFSSLDPVLQQFTQQKLKVKSETSTFTFLQYELSQPCPERVFKRGLLRSAASCQPLSSHHHWSSASPSPRAPPRRPMPPNLNPIKWTLRLGLPPVPKPFVFRKNAKGGTTERQRHQICPISRARWGGTSNLVKSGVRRAAPILLMLMMIRRLRIFG